MWFYECNDPLSEQLRKETQNLFESVNSQWSPKYYIVDRYRYR